jgi:hypothetical protein
MDGAAEGDESGQSVSGAGDVNGDGLADVIVGAWRSDLNGELSGRAYVVFGKADTDGVSLADVAQGNGGFALDGAAAEDFAGVSVSGADDVNGDGLADVVVGALGADPNGLDYAGRTYVVFGKTDTDNVPLADVVLGIGGFVLDGEAEYDTSGVSVSGAGDVNGEGLADVVVGALLAAPNGLNRAGRTYVVFGKTDTDGVSLAGVAQGAGGFVLDGEMEVDLSGWSVSGAGDVNGDGLADVIVGALTADPNGLDRAGRTYVVFGKADTEAVSLADVALGIGGFAMDGEAELDESGQAVSGAGDVNGDGLADVIVGAPSTGRTYVVFGKQDTSLVALGDVAAGVGGFAMDSEAEGDASGGSVSGAGDLNGDGLAEVVVGARAAAPNGFFSGRTYVVFGKADTDRVPLADVAQGIGGFALDGEAQDDHSGCSVSGAGDLNGDAVPDLIVGAFWASPNALIRSGRTYVVFGGDFSCEGG